MNDLDEAMTRECPLCAAAPGDACRTKFGRECEWPHLVRRAERREPGVPVRALCCECGNLRTMSSRHSFGERDPNDSCDDGTHPRGWRMTGTLKCGVCKTSTRHALLRDDLPEHRDVAEREHMGPNYPFRPRRGTTPP
jgi:hypothetical protein